jgi:Tfp pilus assembly protein PilN
MIRVNLLRNRVAEPGTEAVAIQQGSDNTYVRDGLVKLFMIMVGVLGLWMYEGSHKKTLQQEQIRVQAELDQLTAQAADKAKEADTVKDIEVQAKELEDKLKVLKFLSRLRLREVKTLDFMQSSIPEKVWLTDLKYEASKDQPEAGHYSFEGGAVTTDELTDFVKRLENSAYLSDVILIKNIEMPMAGKSLTTREYLFTADVKTQN